MRESRAILVLFFIAITTFVIAQGSRKKLEAQKTRNLKKIQQNERILTETKKRKTATIGQLNAITAQISSQSNFIQNINSEIAIIKHDITELEDIMTSMNNDLEELRAEYSKMVYEAAKASNSYDKLTFLFGAETFNQLLIRLKYIQQYAEARKSQAELIEIVLGDLKNKKQQVIDKQKSKELLLTTKKKQFEKLASLKSDKQNLVKTLASKENELRKDLASRKQSVAKLDRLIADLLKKKTRKKTNGRVSLTPELALLSKNFAGNRRRLIWPVRHGFISQKFGKHPHQVLKGVMVENLGIDIQTKSDEKVRAVFDGKITAVAKVPGMQNVVMIQHGEYFTVYAKLKTVNVKNGDVVKHKQVIGTVHTTKDNISELQFQVWKNSQKLNPETWIARK